MSKIRKAFIKGTGSAGKAFLTETDRGFDRLRSVMKSLKQGESYVKAGVIGSTEKARRPGEPIDNVGLAIVHEFGSPRAGIPERSFIRAGFDKHRPEYLALLKTKLVPAIYEDRITPEKALGLLGLKMVADIQAYVRKGTNLAPNSPETLARKLAKGRRAMGKKQGPVAQPKPLIDTGRLLQSLTSEVVVVTSMKVK